MTLVRMVLEVKGAEPQFGTTSLWVRTVEMAVVPAPMGMSKYDDQVFLLHNAEGDWFSEPVRRRWINYDGTVTIEFRTVRIDPDDRTRQERYDGYAVSWETAIDGDLLEHLTTSGWEEF